MTRDREIFKHKGRYYVASRVYVSHRMWMQDLYGSVTRAMSWVVTQIQALISGVTFVISYTLLLMAVIIILLLWVLGLALLLPLVTVTVVTRSISRRTMKAG
jgi:ABC-type multidrug transport system fused ATPase/permease subunit